MSGIVPSIYEKGIGGVMSYDIFSKLLKERIMFVGDRDISSDQANLIISQLLYLESEEDCRSISMYINSPGGSVSAGLAIYDTMMHIKSPINTICMGMAMSFGAVLLAAGTGKRYALPHSRIMIHQPLVGGGGISGQVTDIEIEAQEMQTYKELLTNIIAYHCKKPYKTVLKDAERNFYMNPAAAKDYGLIDEVLLPNQGFASIEKKLKEKK